MSQNAMTQNVETNRARAVVIIGMGRSGTSMVGGVLEALGVHMGERFKESSRGNPIGYFEDTDFLKLNREILHAAGGDIYNPPEIDAILAQREAFQTRIRSLIQQKQEGCWGWKEPRTSITIELYLEHLCDPHVIVCRRDSMAVARSLAANGEMKVEDGLQLAGRYREIIEGFLSRHPELPRLEVPYESMTRDPEQWIERLVRFLDLRPTREQRDRALALILPKDTLRRLKAKRLIAKGFKQPWKVPAYIMRKITRSAAYAR